MSQYQAKYQDGSHVAILDFLFVIMARVAKQVMIVTMQINLWVLKAQITCQRATHVLILNVPFGFF